MRTIKGLAIPVLLLLLVLAAPSHAGSLQAMSDSELDGIHARGLTFLIDANTFLGAPSACGGNSCGFGDMVFNLGPNNLNLNSSILLGRGAQEGAFGVANAVNSAVNMPINIVVLINSRVNGGVKIDNILSAINTGNSVP